MTEIVMPRLSDTMEEGTILRWLKQDGEHVERGEELVEIETDKANMTYESDQEGTLQIVAREGDTLTVGQTIAHIGESEPKGVATVKQEETPRAEPIREERVKASPVARRAARENDVDLQTLSGTGPGGRIVKADVDAARKTPAAAPAPPALGDVATAKGESTVHELSRTQQTIARRMAESKATIPDFTLHMEIDMERCVALRAELKRLAEPAPPTYNDMIVKACALALREHPRVNASYRDARFQLHARVNVGVAVASEDALVVPTVFDADAKSLGEIARETRALAERVRDGSITPPELGGGTFTVSNLGMYGVHSFTAIVNPPQAAILSVGALEPRAVVQAGDSGDGGEIVVRHMLTVTLACDHRILYGADAAQFLGRVRDLLEQPAALTL
ncbi:MAG TPA: dihydrolipoamide acetyltransferase family protein [Solirubrobacteraceae bacterium]|jgi:pyruvate dehydrogenase E2 component (dihydrolipoamide acetyltransferase)